jgi:hypothetical protein
VARSPVFRAASVIPGRRSSASFASHPDGRPGSAADSCTVDGDRAHSPLSPALEIEDAVVVTRNEKGVVQLHEALNPTAAGAASGAF